MDDLKHIWKVVFYRTMLHGRLRKGLAGTQEALVQLSVVNVGKKVRLSRVDQGRLMRVVVNSRSNSCLNKKTEKINRPIEPQRRRRLSVAKLVIKLNSRFHTNNNLGQLRPHSTTQTHSKPSPMPATLSLLSLGVGESSIITDLVAYWYSTGGPRCAAAVNKSQCK